MQRVSIVSPAERIFWMRLVAGRHWLPSKMLKHHTTLVSMILLSQVMYNSHFAYPAVQPSDLAVAVVLLHAF